MSDKKFVHYSGSNGWNALYVDGNLDTVGHPFLINERIKELIELEVHESDNFMLDRNSIENIAETLDEIREYEENQRMIESEREAEELENMEIARVVRERLKNEDPKTRMTLEELLVELNLTEEDLKDD